MCLHAIQCKYLLIVVFSCKLVAFRRVVIHCWTKCWTKLARNESKRTLRVSSGSAEYLLCMQKKRMQAVAWLTQWSRMRLSMMCWSIISPRFAPYLPDSLPAQDGENQKETSERSPRQKCFDPRCPQGTGTRAIWSHPKSSQETRTSEKTTGTANSRREADDRKEECRLASIGESEATEPQSETDSDRNDWILFENDQFMIYNKEKWIWTAKSIFLGRFSVSVPYHPISTFSKKRDFWTKIGISASKSRN